MISDLVRASGTGAAADLDDIVRVVAALVSAGTGTTSLAATRALRALMKHPDQLALLRREPSLLASAVHELLRYDSGVFGMPRYVLEDFDLRGRSLRKGQLVVLSIMGANRDPRVFPDPDRLDLRRETKEAVTFGRGPHYCIGANLALAQLRAMVEAALDFLPPDARVLEDQVRWSKAGVQSQLKSLPTDFGA
jgi:cytochrome P450